MQPVRLALLLLSVCGLAVGCGPRNRNAPAQVRGEVRHKGEALLGGTITFHSADKGSYSSSIGRDGSYSISDLPDGELGVSVETESVNPNKKTRSMGPMGEKLYAERMAAEGKTGAGKAPTDLFRKIPSKYGDPKTSGLSATLSAGRQTKNFDLTD